MLDRTKPWVRSFCSLVLMGTMGLCMAGCSILGDDDKDDDEDLDQTVSTSRDDERISRERDRDRNPDRNRDRNPQDLNSDGRYDPDGNGISKRGEEERDKAGIPRNAELVARGDNKDLSYRARDDGKIYVQDLDDNGRLVYSGNIDRNQEFRIDGDSQRMTIDGRAVNSQGTLSRDSQPHKYRVYFDRD